MDKPELEQLLKICRLELTDVEKASIKKDITSIINYFNSIEDAKCDSFEAAYQPIDIKERLREDEIIKNGNPDDLLKGTKTYRFFVIGPNI